MGFKTKNMDKQAKKIWHVHNIQHGRWVRPSTRANVKKNLLRHLKIVQIRFQECSTKENVWL